jgi:murein DD-endopeptidase MepM/ murein hydrolase activator NlpD
VSSATHVRHHRTRQAAICAALVVVIAFVALAFGNESASAVGQAATLVSARSPDVESMPPSSGLGPLVGTAGLSAQLVPANAPIPAPAVLAPKPAPVLTTPTGWYTPVARYHLTARFGIPGPWQSGYHTGLDFATKEGTPIRAVTDGVVIFAGDGLAYGNLSKIKIAPHVEIWMAHQDRFAVERGDHVKAGQIVGYVGMTGHTTGPHCHFEVRVKGEPQDPAPFFWGHGQPVSHASGRPV